MERLMPVFEPPVAFDRSPIYLDGQDRLYPAVPFGPAQALMRHYGGQSRGRTVLKLDGVYVTVDVPSTDQVLAATEVYQGGHIYEVSNDVADALQAAGYTVETTNLLMETGDALLTEAGDRLLQEA